MYRSMRKHRDRPKLGVDARSLGVRPNYDLDVDPTIVPQNFDINVHPGDLVHPLTGGMSTSIDPKQLPRHRRPAWLNGGESNDPCWRITSQDLPGSLACRDQPPGSHHVLIEPAQIMTIDGYQQALRSTSPNWEEVTHIP